MTNHPLSSCCNAPVTTNTSIAEPVNCTCTSCGKPCTVSTPEIPDNSQVNASTMEGQFPKGFFEGAILFRGEWVTWEFYKDMRNINEHGHVGDMINGETVHLKKYAEYFEKELNAYLSASTPDSTLREVLGEIGEEDEQSPYKYPTELNEHYIAGINNERQRIRAIINKHLERNI